MVGNFFKIAAALSVYALCAASPVLAQGEERNLSLDQDRAYHSGQARPGTLAIATLLDHADATYGVGETLRMAVKANEDAYVTVFNVGTSGKVTQLFPNGYQADNRIRAGQVLEVPSASSDSRIKVGGPVGVELIKIIATSKPVTIIPDSHFQSSGGQFKILNDGADGLDRDLQVVSANQADDLKVAIIHQLIKTVPPRSGMSSGTALVVPTFGVLTTTAPAASDNSQRFPLLLAVDKMSYRAGEAITMAITPLKPCYLTVIGTDNAGRTRRIFPSTALPAQQIAGMQTLMLSGGSAPQTIVAGKPGKEVVRAVCTTEPRAGTLAVRSATDDLPADEKEAAERDLTVVANRPTAPVGYAEINFGITR
jgi:Domain of unknown function (DUF4384)